MPKVRLSPALRHLNARDAGIREAGSSPWEEGSCLLFGVRFAGAAGWRAAA
ncbi:hypothetical protein [Paenibacillus sp. GCM10012306]|uniref:hypothetical protein n=1 Tax=Paenibacillus sp. GCM10012306 TaxID=3317342 RepID=UPI00360F21B5